MHIMETFPVSGTESAIPVFERRVLSGRCVIREQFVNDFMCTDHLVFLGL
jgi:hypothetical protein